MNDAGLGWLIRHFSWEGVFDACAGTGSAAIAGLLHGRHCLVADKDIADATRRLELFNTQTRQNLIVGELAEPVLGHNMTLWKKRDFLVSSIDEDTKKYLEKPSKAFCKAAIAKGFTSGYEAVKYFIQGMDKDEVATRFAQAYSEDDVQKEAYQKWMEDFNPESFPFDVALEQKKKQEDSQQPFQQP